MRFFDPAAPKVDVFDIPAPVMFDSSSVAQSSNAVTYTLTQTNNGYTLTMTADANWINAADRVYPVTIDPVVLTKQDTKDYSYKYYTDNNTNLSAAGSLYVGNQKGQMGNVSSTIKFNTLPSLSVGDIVTSAKTSLAVNPSNGYSTGDSATTQAINVYNVTGSRTGSTSGGNRAERRLHIIRNTITRYRPVPQQARG